MRSVVGSIEGGAFVGGSVLLKGSARGLRVEGLEDAAMGREKVMCVVTVAGSAARLVQEGVVTSCHCPIA